MRSAFRSGLLIYRRIPTRPNKLAGCAGGGVGMQMPKLRAMEQRSRIIKHVPQDVQESKGYSPEYRWPHSLKPKSNGLSAPNSQFSGCNGVSTYTCGLASLPKCGSLFVDVAIQPEVRFIAKQNSLMKIGNNGKLVLGPFDESTPGLMIVLMNCQTKLRINHLTAVK
ncbi:hypothetical protein TNCV_4103041 [Trichonephila clavipes]|nr:hypothetical protein TNCV_4103041 [Trichonephila clavipes]